MKNLTTILLFFLAIITNSYAKEVLIVADEIPVMEIVAKALKAN